MQKTVILSTDDGECYFPYLKYVQRAWNILGWHTLTFYLGQHSLSSNNINRIINIASINGYNNSTVVQISRLFGFKYISDGILMTSDVDMMPLSNYWKPEYNNITCYGYDLTNFTQIPMCYIAANKDDWKNLIQHDSIESLLNEYHYAKSYKFEDWWFTDQLIITDKILKNVKKPTFIHRGSHNNIALGRIDRESWNLTRNDSVPKIDAHMPRPFSEQSCIDLIENILIPNINNNNE